MIVSDIAYTRMEDGVLTIGLAPPTAVGGWAAQFTVLKRFGGVSGLINKFTSSGYSNVSGIQVTSSGNGIFGVTINSYDTSGLDPGAYVYQFSRTTSGSYDVLSEGYFLLTD